MDSQIQNLAPQNQALHPTAQNRDLTQQALPGEVAATCLEDGQGQMLVSFAKG